MTRAVEVHGIGDGGGLSTLSVPSNTGGLGLAAGAGSQPLHQ